MPTTITAAKAGNWTATDTWTGGVVPVAGDTADLNGFAVTMNVAVIPVGGGSLAALGSPGKAGTLNVSPTTLAADMTVNALLVTAGTGNGIYVLGSSAGKTFTLNCTTLSGGTGSYSVGLNYESSCALVINGNIIGGSGHDAHGVYVSNGNPAAITINGTSITGGAGYFSYGFQNPYAVTIPTINGCSFINGAGGMAYGGRTPRWNPTGNTNFIHWCINAVPAAPNRKFGPIPTAAQLLKDVVCGDVTGTLVASIIVIED